MLRLIGVYRTDPTGSLPPSVLDEVAALMDEPVGEPGTRYRSDSCEIRIYDEAGPEKVATFRSPKGPFICLVGRLYPSSGAGDAGEIERLYSEGGVEGLGDLNGEFAAVVHDPNSVQLVLMKDHVGTRPIYVRRRGNYLYFSSDFRPLARLDPDPVFDKVALVDLLIDGKIGSSRTIIRDVRKIRAGTCLLARGEQVEEIVYWDAAQIISRRLMRRVDPEIFVDSLRRAVADRLEGLEEPYHSYLSGGIDSTLVSLVLAGEAERLGSGPIRTMSYGIDERGWNEERYARKSAERIGSVHSADVMAWHDFPDALADTVFHAQESAKGDGGTTYFCAARFAGSQGASCVFSGDGADGLFGGRPSLVDRAVAEVIFEAIHRHRLAGGRYLARYIKHLLSSPVHGWAQGLGSLLKVLIYGISPVTPAIRQLRISLERARGLLSPDLIDDSEWRGIADDLRREVVNAYSTGPLNAYRLLSLTKSDPSRFRALWNWHRASCTICTYPFMDRRVAEAVLETSPVALYESPRTKDLLRTILEKRGFGPEITEKGKSGFYAPLMTWYQEPLRPFAEDTIFKGQLLRSGLLDASKVRKLFSNVERNWTTIGTLINLEIWLQATYGHSGEGHPPRPVSDEPKGQD